MAKYQISMMIMMVVLPSVVISQGAGAIRYPATIKTKGSTAGTASVTLTNFDNYESIAFSYDATVEMGSTVKLNIKGTTLDGDKSISNGKSGGEEFTRSITQKVTKTKDAKFIHLSVFIQTTLKYADGKEKYGKTSIGVKIAQSGKAAHYWDIKHDYSNNYDGEDEGELCLGCVEEEEKQIDAAKPTTPRPTTPRPPPPIEHKSGNPFGYKWGVSDEPSQNIYRSDAESDGETVHGEYRTLLPDGRTQVVTYTADWRNGYVPKVKYE